VNSRDAEGVYDGHYCPESSGEDRVGGGDDEDAGVAQDGRDELY